MRVVRVERKEKEVRETCFYTEKIIPKHMHFYSTSSIHCVGRFHGVILCRRSLLSLLLRRSMMQHIHWYNIISACSQICWKRCRLFQRFFRQKRTFTIINSSVATARRRRRRSIVGARMCWLEELWRVYKVIEEELYGREPRDTRSDVCKGRVR